MKVLQGSVQAFNYNKDEDDINVKMDQLDVHATSYIENSKILHNITNLNDPSITLHVYCQPDYIPNTYELKDKKIYLVKKYSSSTL